MVPLHDKDANKDLEELVSWQALGGYIFKNGLRAREFMDVRTLTMIRNHFGDDYGWYLAWTNFWTRWLIYAGILGIGMHSLFASVSEHTRWGLYSWYMLLMTGWMTLMFRKWEEYRKQIIKEWKCVGAALCDRAMPLYRTHPKIQRMKFSVRYFPEDQGEEHQQQPVIKKGYRYIYPESRRNCQKLFVIPIVLGFLALNLALGFGVYALEMWISFSPGGYGSFECNWPADYDTLQVAEQFPRCSAHDTAAGKA